MSASAWETCQEPRKMLGLLQEREKLSKRKAPGI
jgi:hypothetical protein